MIRPFFIKLGFLLAAFLAQITLVPHFKIGQAQPDLVLIVVVTLAFLDGALAGTVSGFAGGLLLDLLPKPYMGLSALSKLVVGYLSGLFERTVVMENVFFPVLALLIASLSDRLFYSAFIFLFLGEKVRLFSIFWQMIVPSALYSAAVAPLIYFPIFRLFSPKGKSLV
jgi:rod shape-determining protein MreD